MRNHNVLSITYIHHLEERIEYHPKKVAYIELIRSFTVPYLQQVHRYFPYNIRCVEIGVHDKSQRQIRKLLFFKTQ